MSVKCFTSNIWINLAIISFVGMLIFVIGIPFGTYFVLRRMRYIQMVGRAKKEKDPLYIDLESKQQMREFGSLVEGYDDEFWWWECVEMLKKMALSKFEKYNFFYLQFFICKFSCLFRH